MDSDQLLDFVMDKIHTLMKKHSISKIKLADITGHQRETIHRWFKRINRPSIDAINKLAEHFHLPASYFFPESEGNELPVDDSVLVNQVTEGTTMLTKKVVQAILVLQVHQKKDLLKFLNRSPELLVVSLELADLLSKLEKSRQVNLMSAISKIVHEDTSRQPVP